MSSAPAKDAAKDGAEDASTEAEIAEYRRKLDRTTKVLSAGVFMQLLAMSFTWGARDNLALRKLGDPAAAARFLARNDGIGALAEFLLNPIFGKLSDAYGRKSFVGLAPLWTCIMAGNVVLSGSLMSLTVDKLVTTPMNTSFFTVFRALLTDLIAKTKDSGEFAARNAMISGFAGLGIIIGPVIGGYARTAVSARGRDGDRAAFLMSCALAAVNFLFMQSFCEETLPPNERCELDMDAVKKDMQPLSFTQVWNVNPAVTKMFFAEGFQTLAEGRNISPIQYLLLTQDFKWDMNMFARALSGFGLSLLCGGLMAKKQLEVLGLRLFTTVCNVSNSASMLFQGCGLLLERNLGIRTPVSWAISILLMIAGARKRDGIEACLMLHGDQAGFGRGFMSGAMMNFRAVFNIVTPVVLGQIYAWGKSGGRDSPHWPWVVGAVSNLVAEGILQTLSNGDLFVDENGKALPPPKKKEAGGEPKEAPAAK